MIRDCDRIYGGIVTRRLRAMGIRDKPTAPASPWQNGFAERLIGSIRRECLDHIVVFGEAQIRRIGRGSSTGRETFLSAWQDSEAKPPPAPSPVDMKILRSMFIRETGAWRLGGGETDRTECKANFRVQPAESFSKALRAIAGLATNKGGYLLFGVTDGSFQADGLADETFAKSLSIPSLTSRRLSSSSGASRSASCTWKSTIMARSSRSRTSARNKEGGIYFRYVGETRLIKPGELRQIVAGPEQRTIAEFSARMGRVAISKEATIDLDSGEVAGTSGKFVIDKALLPNI
jgi:hypothetical protein